MDFDTPVKPFTEVESEWIRQEIQNRDFDDREDREYVNRLVKIEHYVLNGASGFASGMVHNRLKRQHADEYDEIQKELRPEGFSARKKRERGRERERQQKRAKRKIQAKERVDRARQQWAQINQDCSHN